MTRKQKLKVTLQSPLEQEKNRSEKPFISETLACGRCRGVTNSFLAIMSMKKERMTVIVSVLFLSIDRLEIVC